MSIPLSGSNGDLFETWGKIIGGQNEAQNLVNGTLTARVADVNAQFSAGTVPSIPQLPSSNLSTLQTQLQAAPSSYLAGMNTMLQNTLIQMALDANPTLNPINLRQSLIKMIAQMNVGGYAVAASIQRPTISVSVTAGSANVGNGVMVSSLTDSDGRPLDYCLAETLTATCTDDGYPGGGATAGSEPFTMLGQVAAASIYAYNYPAGSGANVQMTTLDPALTSGLILTDGNFEIWSGSPAVLTDWSIGVGVAGTTVKQATSPFTGVYNLQIVGDGSELTKVRQAVTLAPNTVYAINAWMKTDGSVAAGVIQMRLVTAATPTASASTVINNDAGMANSVSKTVSTLTSSYANVSGFFQTPTVLPSTVYLEFYVSTAITSTEVLNIDSAGLVAASQAYPGGPWSALFTGNTPFAIGDTFTAAVANNSTIATFSRQLSRYFDLPGLGLKIPSANSPSISDSLIN